MENKSETASDPPGSLQQPGYAVIRPVGKRNRKVMVGEEYKMKVTLVNRRPSHKPATVGRLVLDSKDVEFSVDTDAIKRDAENESA